MAGTVFILGAGASSGAGAPLMGEMFAFADKAKNGPLKNDASFKQSLELVQKTRRTLRGIDLYSGAENDNLKSIYAALEMGVFAGSLPDVVSSDVPRILPAITEEITKTIRSSMQIKFGPNDFRMMPYYHFTDLVRKIGGSNVAVITFNYDCALDIVMETLASPPNYVVANMNQGSWVRLLKLHGSLNWFKCEICNSVTPTRLDLNISAAEFAQHAIEHPMAISQVCKPGICWSCGKQIENSAPFIVPPTFNKTRYYEPLREVWAEAHKALAEANEVVVCGYSFPSTDLFFDHFLQQSFWHQLGERSFRIYDPSKVVCERYQSRLSPLKPIIQQVGFEQMVEDVRERSGFQKLTHSPFYPWQI